MVFCFMIPADDYPPDTTNYHENYKFISFVRI